MSPIATIFGRFGSFLALTAVVLVLSGPALAGKVNTGYFGNVAIKGYDPVAYFTENRAVKGSEDFAYSWLGAEWHFASADNRDRFAGNPVQYAPQYGGFCADGVAYGTMTVNIDPEAFNIIDGKLYLNFDQGAKEELEQIPGQVDKAEATWPEIQARLEAE